MEQEVYHIPHCLMKHCKGLILSPMASMWMSHSVVADILVR